MPHLILNELVVKNLTKKQKRELTQLLESDGVFDDPFDTILPVPEDVKVTGEEKWCRVNWGTEGLFGDFGCISFEKDTWFGDHEDDHTLIVTFLTVLTPPMGTVAELSRRYPEALFDLRTIDYDDTDAEVQWFRVFEGVAKLRNFDSKEHCNARSKLLRQITPDLKNDMED